MEPFYNKQRFFNPNNWCANTPSLGIGAFFLLLILVFCECHYVQLRRSDAATIAVFQKRKLFPKIKYYAKEGRKIRFIAVGDETKPNVLLIHGAPSSSYDMEQMMMDTLLLSNARLIAVDRPGYGYSGFGTAVPSIEQQAELIKPVLDSLNKENNNPTIVFGTSYGGPIACKLAMDYPKLVDGLVLGAPAIAPGQEKTYDISYAMKKNAWYSRWIFPKMLRVATDEKFAHKQELEKLLPDWKKIKSPVIFIQGNQDNVVYTSNADFAEKQMVNAVYFEKIIIPNQGHFLTTTQPQILVNAIVKMVNLTKKVKAKTKVQINKKDRNKERK